MSPTLPPTDYGQVKAEVKPDLPSELKPNPPSSSLRWNNLEHHDHASIFPLLEGAEFEALVEDIKANGIREPITLLGGKILDGRNRYRAGLKAGVVFTAAHFIEFEKLTNQAGGPLGYVVSVNLKRRHLNEGQRSLIAAAIAKKRLGDNQHSGEKKISNTKAAEMLNVGVTSVKVAKDLVDKGSEELVNLVRDNEASLASVAEVLAEPKEKQVTSWKAKKDLKVKEREKKAAERAAAKGVAKKNEPIPESTRLLQAVDEMVVKWESFGPMQRRSFVERCRTDIELVLKEIVARTKAA